MKSVDRIKNIVRKFRSKKILNYDNKQYSKYYASSASSIKEGDLDARNILVYCHVVEKGLSHEKIKPLFGYDKVLIIADSLKQYLLKGGDDTYVISLAYSTLNIYNSVNRQLGVTDDKLIKIPDISKTKAKTLDIGVNTLTAEQYFNNSNNSFNMIAFSRHSVRLYDCCSSKIEYNELLNCIEIAQNCPSACNRQGVRVKLTNDKNKIKEICDIQGGCKGFGENAGALLIITSKISLYTPDERRIPMLDCGLFVMNLVYALYEKKLGSCILNGSFTLEREKAMKKVLPIPNDEMYSAVVAVSKIPDNEKIRCAHSCKREVHDIVSIVD